MSIVVCTRLLWNPYLRCWSCCCRARTCRWTSCGLAGQPRLASRRTDVELVTPNTSGRAPCPAVALLATSAWMKCATCFRCSGTYAAYCCCDCLSVFVSESLQNSKVDNLLNFGTSSQLFNLCQVNN